MTSKLPLEIVKKNALLARLAEKPSNDFLDKYSAELGSIIGYIDQLSEVSTDGISPLEGVRTNTISELREDKITDNQEQAKIVRQNIIDQFPARKGTLLEVPSVFNE